MTTFAEFAAVVLEHRAEDGIRGIASERNRYALHIAGPGWSPRRRRPSRKSTGYALVFCDRQSPARANANALITSTAMPSAIDLTGRKFHYLTVLRFTGLRRDGGGHSRRMYLVLCVCGVEKELPGIYIASGNTKSCGCKKNDPERCVTHGETRGGWTSEYRAWQSMISRCHRTGSSGFLKYGAKGTRVCDEWRTSYEAFLSHVGRKPTPDHSLDRIDPYGHYEPGNVRWATPIEQMNNQRRHHPRQS